MDFHVSTGNNDDLANPLDSICAPFLWTKGQIHLSSCQLPLPVDDVVSMTQSQQLVGASVITSTSLPGRLSWRIMSAETALQVGHSRILFSLILWCLCFKGQKWQKMCRHGSVVSIVPRSVSRRLKSLKQMPHWWPSLQYLLWSVPKVGQSIIKSDELMMDCVWSNAQALGTCKIYIVRRSLSWTKTYITVDVCALSLSCKCRQIGWS